jgi:putative heme-binding domain-containing protein
MVYLGDNWPEQYRNQLFTFNLHGNRINQDLLERRGSGYVARHGADVLLANDPWFRGMTVKYGPDGGVYLSDWSDTGECHNYEVADRTNGRIYKVVYGDAAPWHGNLAQLEDAALVNLLAHRNHWFARRAQRLLQERSAAGALEQGTIDGVLGLLRTSNDATVVLRALWTLHVAGAAADQRLAECMASPHDVVRGWAVRLAADRPELAKATLSKLAALARSDRSPWVRLALAAALQRLPLEDRWSIAEALASHGEDAGDANIPLMLWYGVEPLVPADPQQALRLARQSQIPLICRYIVRRMTSSGEAESLAAAVALLAEGPGRVQEPALAGLYEAIHGRRRLPMPADWPAAYLHLAASEQPGVREQAMQVALIFGDPEALSELRRVAGDSSADAAVRRQAIASLTQAEAPELATLLRSLLDDAEVRVEALRGLAALDDPATPEAILKRYAAFDAEARKEAVSALASRKAYAALLLDAVENASIPRGDISAFHVQQLQNLKDGRIDERLTALWGSARLTSADRLEAIARQKQRLTTEELARADLSHGRALFAKTCAACHRLFDDGGKIGPELTGSQRANLDYVLSNVLDPSAIVAKDYQLTLFQTADGRVLSGIATGEDDHSVTVQTATEAVVVPKEEIELRETSPMSMMPDGLLSALGDDDIRDLVGYLASPRQVPLPGE